MKNLLLTLAFGLVSLVSISQIVYIDSLNIDTLDTEQLEQTVYVMNADSLTILSFDNGNDVIIHWCYADFTSESSIENDYLAYTTDVFSDTTMYMKIFNPLGDGSGNIHLTIVFQDPSASTSQNTLTSEVFKVYPSPATSEVKISFLADSRDMPVNIFSLNGQLVYSNSDFREVGFTILDVDLTEFHSGIYFVKIGNHTEKLIIE